VLKQQNLRTREHQFLQYMVYDKMKRKNVC